MKELLRLMLILFLPVTLCGQIVEWKDVSSNYELPEGLKFYEGSISGNTSFSAWYFEVDMDVPEIAIRPYLSASPMSTHDFSAQTGAYAVINGGFFAGTSSVSSVVFPGEVAARNLTALTRNTKTYPVIRPLFAVNKDRSLAAEWVYHHSYNFDDIYIYDEPMAYACDDPDPLPSPVRADGRKYEDIAYGLGGGPMLIKDGEIRITYCEEIFWGSGVELTDYRPRTAVGYTSDNKVIMFVANSMMVGQMAEELLALGCYEAINLDGGQSSSLAIGNESIYYQERAVPTILAVVHSDSLHLPKTPAFEKFMDTSDEGVTRSGEWFATANEGYWQSASMLHPLGTEEDYYEFPLSLPAPGTYEVYGWWTSHANRATDTPFVISHSEGTTTVPMNQSIGGSMWNLVGTFDFEGNENDKIRITAAATTNQFVVADGIRLVSYDPALAVNEIVSIQSVGNVTVPFGTEKQDALAMLASETTIADKNNDSHIVQLNWNIEDYDGNTEGDYTAVGTFVLPEGVEQTDPPTELSVQATITVSADDTFIDTPNSDDSFRIYPNPTEGIFTVEGNFSGNHSMVIFNIAGSKVYEKDFAGYFKHEINLSEYSRGVYMLRITGEKNSEVRKVILR